MGKFRIDAEVRWSTDTQRGTQGNIPIEFFAPGDGSLKVGSEQAKSVGELLSLFEMANGTRMLTVALKVPYANLYFRPQWNIDAISLGMYDGVRLVAQARCNSPRRAMSVEKQGIRQTILDFHDNDEGIVAFRT